MRENSTRTSVTFVVGKHLVSRLDAMASANGRTRKDMIIDCIIECVENYEEGLK